MCDYCGCRRSWPTTELAAEHVRLLELGDVLHTALHDGTDAAVVFDEFVRLLQMHAAKEEVGLFVHAKSSTPLADRIDALCREHDDLHRWLADGLTGPHVPEALRLLVTHIDNEEYDLFPTSSTPSTPNSGTRSNSPTERSKPPGTNPPNPRRHDDPRHSAAAPD